MTHTRYRVEAAGEPRPFPPEAMARIEGILKRYPTKQAALLPVLWLAQETFGWISKESAEEVARILDLPVSHIDGVLTFYTMFNLRPMGRNLLQVCTSISCHLLGRREARRPLPPQARHRSRGDHEGREVHAGRGRVHRGMRPRPVDDGQRQVLRADGRGEARSAPRPARPGVLTWKTVLSRRVGTPNSQSIDTYLADGGYAGLRKVLTGGMTPEQVTEEVKKSGLRGRGGAGFSAGVKWGFLPKDTKGKPIYLLCNADESEPGTFKDRLLMENDPHQLIEGMLLSAYAIRCKTAYIYIRGEFHDGARILNRAVEEAYARGFLGENILGSGFSLDITVHRGAGAYICGEETGLIESPRGQARPTPHQAALPRRLGRLRVPRPSSTTSRPCAASSTSSTGAPTGSLKLGRNEKNTGPKLFCVSGHVNRPGVYEAAMGLPFKELLYGDGLRPGHPGRQEVEGGHPRRRLGGHHAHAGRDRGLPARLRRRRRQGLHARLGRDHRHGRGHLHRRGDRRTS